MLENLQACLKQIWPISLSLKLNQSQIGLSLQIHTSLYTLLYKILSRLCYNPIIIFIISLIYINIPFKRFSIVVLIQSSVSVQNQAVLNGKMGKVYSTIAIWSILVHNPPIKTMVNVSERCQASFSIEPATLRSFYVLYWIFNKIAS